MSCFQSLDETAERTFYRWHIFFNGMQGYGRRFTNYGANR